MDLTLFIKALTEVEKRTLLTLLEAEIPVTAATSKTNLSPPKPDTGRSLA